MRVSVLPVTLLFSVALVLGGVQAAAAQFYAQHNLVSDGAVPADLVDPNVVNAWGLVSGPTTPWWIADNGSGRTTLYTVTSVRAPSRRRSQCPARVVSRARRPAWCSIAARALS